MTLKISVITASFNSVSTIKDSIESLNTQGYPFIESVWVDGASTDGTYEVLNELTRATQSTFISEPDKGIYDALNKGIRLATGDIIGFLHADDLLANTNTLELVAKAFEDPTVNAVYGDLVYVTRGNPNAIVRHWKSSIFNLKLLSRGWMPPHPTLYLRKCIYQQIGFFDTSYKIASDYDFILRVFSMPDIKSVYIPHTLVKMRVGGVSNASIGNIILKSTEDLRALRSNKIGNLTTLALKNISKISQFFYKKY